MMDNDDPSRASARIAKDLAAERAPNPKRHFQSPEMLMADASLSDAEKHALLSEWELDIENRLRAEEEGMSAADPMRQDREAKLADEAARVKTLMSEIAARLNDRG